jgi:cysteine desulfurase family protein
MNMNSPGIYFDNAATSWPKPPEMITAMQQFSEHVGANPGRAGHRMSIQSARIVYETRQALADLFNFPDPLRVVFSTNVTEAINLAIFGLINPGDHVITSSMEHNAVMRPLRYLQSHGGVQVSTIKCSPEGTLDPLDILKQIHRDTKMVIMTHASNVTGTILPLHEVGQITREHGLLFLVDAAQTAGVLPIDMQNDHIDLLAFTGHKSLYGPMGTGGLVIGQGVDLAKFNPLKMGGTGSNSEKEEQPDFLPDKFESGTLNVIGLAGLNASLQWIHKTGIDRIRAHEEELTAIFLEGMKLIEKSQVFGPVNFNLKTAVIPFIFKGRDNAGVGGLLDERFGIFCRVGLHCAPSAARTIGAFPDGTIRFSFGYFNQRTEVEMALDVLNEISGG